MELKIGDKIVVERFACAGAKDHEHDATVVSVGKAFAKLNNGERVRLKDGAVFPKYLDYTKRIKT